jgi:hypothetical protein
MATILLFSFMNLAQEQVVIALKSEPHHHLTLHNNYVNVYSVYVSPHDSVLLHKHDADAISIVMSNSEITVRAPGKPDSQQRVVNGQVRLQSAGYVHSLPSTETLYQNIANFSRRKISRNLCLWRHLDRVPRAILGTGRPRHLWQPQFQTDQTKVTLIRILPLQA